ncbi:uncharacterized protein PAC_06590 [Phialocephala subalpina]|uniref:Chromo domain-containing protein n=1 Tax=Phialocephala subalpina TaxID=576137 RepID=A0A1L7WVB4_9HELO|nr:uncharacterized protein PAC_06590 [Phialocephala subalpina]
MAFVTLPREAPYEALIENAKHVIPASITPSNASFTPFPKLPVELQVRIWQYACRGPRLVKLKKLAARSFGRNQYTVIPPPLLRTCKISRKEALRVYEKEKKTNEANQVTSSKWMRYDYDILHIKDLSFAGFAGWCYGTAHKSPKCLQHMETIAVSRDLINLTQREYLNASFEAVIRAYFPKLRLLIILIDDRTNIKYTWNISGEGYQEYEKDEPTKAREGLVRLHSGPFKEVIVNKQYAQYIEQGLQSNFDRLSRLHNNYVAPYSVVMGYSLPAWVEGSDHGRVPDDYAGAYAEGSFIDGVLEYEVQTILDSCIRKKRLCYKVKWFGFPKNDTWYPATYFDGAQEIVNIFHEKYPDKPNKDTEEEVRQDL